MRPDTDDHHPILLHVVTLDIGPEKSLEPYVVLYSQLSGDEGSVKLSEVVLELGRPLKVR